MKKIFLIFILFATVLVAQNKSPKISIEPMTYDYGTIYGGQIVNHEYMVKNVGSGILTIDRVRSSCGCTAVKPLKSHLEAGEETTINVKFNTGRRRGDQKKYVYIFCNDPKNPEIRLAFKAHIIPKGSKEAESLKAPELKLSSNYHDFGDVKEGDILELDVPFWNIGDDVLKISRVKTTCGCTAALLSNTELKPNEKGNLKIEYDTTDRVGKTTRLIIIHSNDPKNAQHVISLVANIKER